ncbi:unnamed protein product [Darwinula stevensoni]|uniref:CUB domain-containing protein n=1 Tax=Darwinula stevensoni TaxID=69355 RepID=A0A7R8XJ82_9CRUS|nr:unnamed protein product [Darwinula stevensoni]CAG0894577.1 unnamed protein product [Darwinula stevensoni]
MGSTQDMPLNTTETYQSPNYPRRYPNNYYDKRAYRCQNNLTLSCPVVRIQWSNGCWKDALTVSGNRDQSVCGQTSLSYFVPGNTWLTIVFRTNFLIRDRGFQCTLTCPP